MLSLGEPTLKKNNNNNIAFVTTALEDSALKWYDVSSRDLVNKN
jgi:hypothetical protein